MHDHELRDFAAQEGMVACGGRALVESSPDVSGIGNIGP
jgi:hypothetical protein